MRTHTRACAGRAGRGDDCAVRGPRAGRGHGAPARGRRVRAVHRCVSLLLVVAQTTACMPHEIKSRAAWALPRCRQADGHFAQGNGVTTLLQRCPPPPRRRLQHHARPAPGRGAHGAPAPGPAHQRVNVRHHAARQQEEPGAGPDGGGAAAHGCCALCSSGLRGSSKKSWEQGLVAPRGAADLVHLPLPHCRARRCCGACRPAARCWCLCLPWAGRRSC